MKLKRLAKLIGITLFAIALASNFNIVNAAIADPGKYLKITDYRKSGYAYQALEKNIWEIVETNLEGTTIDHSATIYCLKGGPGFGSSDYNNEVKQYTRYFDMKDSNFINTTDPGTLIYRNALPEDEDDYYAVLWILEHAYIAPASAADEEEAEAYKEKLFDEVFDYDPVLTDDDIDVVQQLAIWHFTNDDSYDAEETFQLYISNPEAFAGSTDFIALDDDRVDYGEWRQEDAIILYTYFITEAEKAAKAGWRPQTESQPYELANLTQTVVESGDSYIIGPFRIEQNGDVEASLSGTFTDGNEDVINDYTLRSSNESSYTTYSSLEETVENNFYLVVPNTTNIDTITLTISGNYYNTTIEYWSVEGADSNEQPVVIIEREQKDYNDSTTFEKPEDENFDLALRKFITSIIPEGESSGTTPENRVPTVNEEQFDDLYNRKIDTVEKTHSKTPLTVETGDSVIYTIRVYNEGNVDAYVTEITDYLPDGLTLKEDSQINTKYDWTEGQEGEVTTDYLKESPINAFDGDELDYEEVQIECEVTARVQKEDTSLINIAEITGATDKEGTARTDLDSIVDNLTNDQKSNYNPNTSTQGTGYEDDDDYEELVLLGKYFDLSLRKFISSIDGEDVENREPDVDLDSLLQGDDTNDTTATYNHDKEPLGVKVGDEIIYTIRVYNEGQIDGYVTEITDYLPEGLEFVDDDFNEEYEWTVDESNSRIVKTTILSDELINAFNGSVLDYKEVQIKCRVTSDVTSGDKLTNIAEITGFTDVDGYEVEDRDSQERSLTLPDDSILPTYKDTEINSGLEYIPGQQDDDDFEKVVVLKFDLALRKFITGVNEETVTGREPEFSIVNGEYTYTHTKDPVSVKKGDIVIYTIRVYNEGEIAGYAKEIKDDIPEGLEFVPESDTNKNYRWVMYDADGKVTEDATKAVEIRTDYLSREQGEDNLIPAFDSSSISEPAYKEVRVAFRVTEPNSSDRVIINIAEISDDADEDGEEIDDEDSIPDNNEEDEDDIDIEKIVVEEFDLALRKFITSIIPEGESSGTTPENRVPTVNEEQFDDLYNRKIDTVEKTHSKTPLTVETGDSVIYTIRVYNEGNVDAYVTEITDYLPDGLTLKEDSQINTKYDWTEGQEGEVTTDYLKESPINAFDGDELDYEEVQIECEVTARVQKEDTSLINIAEITGATDKEGTARTDLDSIVDNLTNDQKSNYNPSTSTQGKGYEDDDDYEELVIPAATGDFELKLIKINGLGSTLSGATFKVEEINSEGEVIATYEELTTNENGEVILENIAIGGQGSRVFVITEEKAPAGYTLIEDEIIIQVNISLNNGAYIISAIQLDEIPIERSYTDDLAESETSETETTELASTKISSSNITNSEETASNNLISNRAQLISKVRETENTIITTTNLTKTSYNSSEVITEDEEEIVEGSSSSNSAVKDITINGNTIEITIENSYFDLSLRKFITGVNEETITDRVPVFSIDENGDYVYTHTKDPVEVSNGDIVIYTLRVYNEGEIAGYAEQIKDDIPEGLEFIVDNEINTEYKWVMYDADGNITEDVSQAVEVRTDYLSKAQGEEAGRDNLLEGFNPETMTQPDYKEVQIAFRVIEPNTSDRILINTAEISEDADEEGDPVEDIDSTPDNDEEGEDDIDEEQVKVTYFDLALRKIIAEVTTIYNGKTTVQETGHAFEDNPEAVVKIELVSDQISNAIIKFTYKIQITNEGSIAGYAYEIKDYVPEGLEFVAEDNNEHWTLSEDGKTVTSDELADTLLEPGESAVIEITFRWINGQNNFGLKTNWAEISEDSDDDIDSTPDNFVEGEDDIDYAEVVLSIKTGIGEHYGLVIAGTLSILAVGIVLIKRFVI